MNVQEYKNKRIKDIEKLLKGIHFENIGIQNKQIIGDLTPEASDFFNMPSLYRQRTEELLKKISEYKTKLLGIKLEFVSPEYEKAKEEIELAIKEFVEKIRLEINFYKHDIIKLAFQHEPLDDSIKIDELPEVKEKNMINTGLNFINIKVGEKEYSLPRIGTEAEKEDVTINNIRLMILYIYILKLYIEDKKRKHEEFIDFVATNFDVKEKEEYLAMRKLQSAFLNEKVYDVFVEKYNGVVEEVVSIIIEREEAHTNKLETPKSKS